MPQWNCGCANCSRARTGELRSRTQSGAALRLDGAPWFLVNASPDLRTQVESLPDWKPEGLDARRSSIRDVLLTNADLDHVLGLFLLREQSESLRIHCTAAVRETLQRALRIDALLANFCGVEWHELPLEHAPWPIGRAAAALTYRAIPLPGDAPRYTAHTPAASFGQSVALEFVDRARDKYLLFAPDVAAITPQLRQAMETADAILFDGTFWSEDELQQVDPAARTATAMGHWPISCGSLEALRGLRAPRRIYTHINNTNPILDPASPAAAEVRNAGVIIGEDGMDFEL